MKVIRLTREKDETMKGLKPFDTIVNAARPLCGVKTWQGDCIWGVFYAAYDRKYQPKYHEFNEEMNAVELRYYTIDQAKKALKMVYTDEEHQKIIDTLPDDKIALQFDICFNEQRKDFPKNI